MENPPLTNQVISRLRQEGGRMTAQRRLVIEALETLDGHSTAEEVYARASLSDPTLHLSTVYRTLRWLEECGFVSPRWFTEHSRAAHFDTASDLPAGHQHFVCRNCGQVIEFADPLLERIRANFQQHHSVEIEAIQLTLYGLCDRCGELP
jgi:Fur family ferric uptake transcriptional regulator